MKQNQTLVIVALALVFSGLGFFGGLTYQKSKTPNFGGVRGQFQQNGQPGNGQRRAGIGQLIGEIISADSSSLTVKTVDGSSKIVIFNDKTSINKAESATATDLTVGQKVAVFGTTNTDGSVSAQNIQLNPMSRGFARPTP